MYLRIDFSLCYRMVLLALTMACLLPTSYSIDIHVPLARMSNTSTIRVTIPVPSDRSTDRLDLDLSGESGSGDSASATDISGDSASADSLRDSAGADISGDHINADVPKSSSPTLYFPPIIDCALIALEDSEFTYVDDSEVVFRGEATVVIFWTATGRPVVCSNFEQNGTIFINITTNVTTLQFVFPKGFAIASYIGCSLSVAASFFLLVTYSLFKELRTLPSLLLMSLSLAFLVGDLLILLGSFLVSISLVQSRAPCVVVAILLHYFFLARFCWTNMIAFEMVRTFTAAMKLMPVLSTRAKRTVFAVYSLIGWGVPLLITLVSIIVNFASDSLVRYGVDTCWINDVHSTVVAFVAPLALSLLFNLLSFIWIVVNLCKNYTLNKTGKQNQLNVRLYVAVFSVMGLTWIFGFIAILARSSWAWYPFIILNSTQALVVSLSFTCTKKIAGYYIELLSSSIPLLSSVPGNQSTASNKVSPTTAAT